jgi:hypothetical protein
MSQPKDVRQGVGENKAAASRPTLVASAIRLNVSGSHPSVLHLECVALAPGASEDGGAVKAQVERLCEGPRWVAEESYL